MSGEARGALPVVFVHGIRISGTLWRPVTRIVGASRPVAAPDLPGHGTRRGERCTLDGAVEAVADAIDGLGGRALVVGHSLGGYVGIATAARHPERVAGLVAIGCTCRPVGAFAAGFRTAARVLGAFPALGNRLSALGFRRALPAPVADAVLAGGLCCEVMPQAVDAVVGFDPVAAIGAYPGPVWLVNGGRDGFRKDEQVFLAACREGHLTVLPGRDHITCLADPAALAEIVETAAAAVPRRSAAVGPERLPDLGDEPPR
jgi:pimeloyl-ACP methyl ester carboxylesterase